MNCELVKIPIEPPMEKCYSCRVFGKCTETGGATFACRDPELLHLTNIKQLRRFAELYRKGQCHLCAHYKKCRTISDLEEPCPINQFVEWVSKAHEQPQS